MGEGDHLYGDRAPHNLQYVVLVASSNLTQERVLTGTANQITVTDGGAGAAVTLSISSTLLIPGVITIPNTGLHILDTNASHDLIIVPGSDLEADRQLTLTTGDAARTITLSGNPTLDDWFDQSVKVAASPTFADVFVPDGGMFGISGNELLTFNAAGTAVFSGCNVGIGITPTSTFHISSSTNPGFRLAGSGTAGYADLYTTFAHNTEADTASAYVIQRARGTIGTPLIVANGDRLGIFIAQGYDGNAYQTGAAIRFYSDGAPAAGDMPGRIQFYTTLDGGTTEYSRLVVKNNGNVGIGVDAPDGRLHVQTATAGGVIAQAASDDFVVEHNDHGGISILVPATKAHQIAFGTPTSNVQGRIIYDEPNAIGDGVDGMSFWCDETKQAYLLPDGDFYLNTIVNENAFDEYDDNMLITGLRAMVVPDGHFLKERFGKWINQAKPILEKTGIVNYGRDGQMFIASKKLQMLSIDAVRQLYDRINYLEQRMKMLEC